MEKDLSLYISKLNNFDKKNQSRFLEKIIEYSLDAVATELPEIEYSRANYNRYFNRGTVESPVATLKMGGNQFEKFAKADRNNLIKAAFLTLVTPSLVIEKDSYDKLSDSFKPLHVYGKSFYRVESGNKRVVESVVVFKDENNIVIGSHNNDIENFVKQIKTADQIVFADPEISRMIVQLNKEVGNPVSLYGMNTEALNPRYDKSNILSIIMDEKVIERITVNPTRVNIVPPVPNISQSQEKSIELLKKENERLKKENLELGKQIMKIAYQQTKNEKQNLSQNKTKSKDDDYGFGR